MNTLVWVKVVTVDSNRWSIVTFIVLVLTLTPVFLIALGLGWAWRGMTVGLHKLIVSSQTSRITP